MTRDAPLVSVVLPFYNARRWIGSALSSVFAQGVENFEVIAIDDGSTDGGDSLCKVATPPNVTLKLIRNTQNVGIVQSLNRGLDEAKGRFIARMDADDICIPNRLRRQVDFLETTGLDVCGSWFVEFGQGLPRKVRWPHTEAAVQAAMMFQNTLCHPTVMARRAVFERYRYRDEYRLVEDYDLFARALADFRIANLPEALLRYRRHPDQATQAKRDAMESLTKRVRLEVLGSAGIKATPSEQRIHNMIRAPASIRQISDLQNVEAWLSKLLDRDEDPDYQRVVASQWTRACIRAAPLGMAMLRTYRSSPLHAVARTGIASSIDMAALAAMRLDYRSPLFATLRRIGLSA